MCRCTGVQWGARGLSPLDWQMQSSLCLSGHTGAPGMKGHKYVRMYALRRADGGSHRSSGRRVVWRPSQVGSEAQGMLAGSGYARLGRACRCAGDHWGAQVSWLLHGASTCQSCAGCPSLELWACCPLAVGQHIQVHPFLHHPIMLSSCAQQLRL